MNRPGPQVAIERWGCGDVEVRFKDSLKSEWTLSAVMRGVLLDECMKALGFVTDKSLYPRWVRRATWKEG